MIPGGVPGAEWTPPAGACCRRGVGSCGEGTRPLMTTNTALLVRPRMVPDRRSPLIPKPKFRNHPGEIASEAVTSVGETGGGGGCRRERLLQGRYDVAYPGTLHGARVHISHAAATVQISAIRERSSEA